MTDLPGPLASPEEFATLLNGEWTVMPDGPIRHIRADIELIEPGLEDFVLVPELFYRGKGIGRDNALLTCVAARERGARGLIVTEPPRNLSTDVPCLIVADTAEAISPLAEHRRSTSQAKFVAVTGSAGKSTTKEMIASVLSSKGKTAKSTFNYNAGRRSVELTLSNVAEDHEFCCAEFSVIGDIEIQTEIYRPDIAVITNVMWEHFDHFEKKGLSGDQVIDAIIELKTSLIRNLTEGGHAILNRDDKNFGKQLEAANQRPDVHIVTFGKHPDADVRLVDAELEPNGSLVRASIGGREVSYRVGIPGQHMVANSLAALAVASIVEIDLDKALGALSELEAGFRRGEVHTVPWGNGTITAINETVSSNVPALRALIRTFSGAPVASGGRRVAVLGWIGDVGTKTIAHMKELATEAAASPIDYFYTNGEDMRHFNQFFPDRSRIARHAGSIDQLRRMLEAELRPGDTVAFKSNRKPPEFTLRHLWKKMIDPRIQQKSDRSSAGEEPQDEVRIVVGGDTYFGEYYQTYRAKQAKINYLEEFGYKYSSEKLKPLFERADISIINLECALTELETSPLDGRKGYILGGLPDPTVDAMKDLSVDAVLLGNNHTMDYGEQGLRDTLDTLEEAGIAAIGAGPDKMSSQAAYTCEFFRAGSRFKLAILSGYEFNNTYEKEYKFFSGDHRPGVNNINIPRLREQIAELKADGYFVVVSPHWGENYCLRNYDQGRLARRMIYDCRADLIVGHGPHVYNEFAKLDENWVLYSIGNLIFNSEGEYARHQLAPYSYLTELVATFHEAGYRLALNMYPIISCNQISQFQPDFLDDVEFERFAEILKMQQYDPDFFDDNIEMKQEDGRNFFQIKLI